MIQCLIIRSFKVLKCQLSEFKSKIHNEIRGTLAAVLPQHLSNFTAINSSKPVSHSPQTSSSYDNLFYCLLNTRSVGGYQVCVCFSSKHPWKCNGLRPNTELNYNLENFVVWRTPQLNLYWYHLQGSCPHPKLTHWGRVMHILVSKLTTTGSDNGLLLGRNHAIIWTNAGILLIGHLRTTSEKF